MEIQNIINPINPKEFVVKFSKKFQKWGNTITSELKDTWKQNCLVFNNVIANKDKAIKYVIAAPTGSAKTENTITYCAMLPQSVKVLICTNLIDEVDRLATEINKESKDNRAYAFHSGNKSTIKDALKFQIMVTTHAFYKSNIKKNINKWKKISANRDLVIIDEGLTTIDEISVDINNVTIAFNFFEALRREKKVFNELKFHHLFNEDEEKYYDDKILSYELDLIRLTKELDKIVKILDTEKTGTYLAKENDLIDISENQDNSCLIKRIAIPILINYKLILKKHKFQCNKILTGINDETNDKKIQHNILKTLENISRMQYNFAYVSTDREVKSLNTIFDYLPKQSVALLDATADINNTYKLRQKYHKDLLLIERINNVRDYSNVTLFHANTNTGKNNYTKDVFEAILKKVAFGIKTLIIVSKKNIDTLSAILSNTYKSHEIDIASWGSLTGLNNWKDFDTCIILGLNHKTKIFSQNRVVANTNENIAFGTNQNQLNIDIEVSDLVSEIVQAMNRIRIRKVTTLDGKCEEAKIYLTLPHNSLDYMSLIRQHMTNINSKEWDIGDLSSKSTILEKVITYLNSYCKVGDKIKISTIQEQLGINPESFRNTIGKNKESKEKFKENLNKYGFDILEIKEKDNRNRERKNPTQYIYRP